MAYRDPSGSRSGRTSGRTTRRHRNRLSESQTVYNHNTERYERYKVSGYYDQPNNSGPTLFTTGVRQVGYRPAGGPSGKGPNFKRKSASTNRGPNFQRKGGR